MKKHTSITIQLLLIIFFVNTTAAMRNPITDPISAEGLLLKQDLRDCLIFRSTCTELCNSTFVKAVGKFLKKYNPEEINEALFLLSINNKLQYEQKKVPSLALCYAGAERSYPDKSISFLDQAIDNNDAPTFQMLLENPYIKHDIDPIMVLKLEEISDINDNFLLNISTTPHGNVIDFKIFVIIQYMEKHQNLDCMVQNTIQIGQLLFSKEEKEACSMLTAKIQQNLFTIEDLFTMCVSITKTVL
jgi:hypothetical protein